MDLSINIDLLRSNQITPTQYLYLYEINQKKQPSFPISDIEIRYLEGAGWLKNMDGNIVIRSKFLRIFKRFLVTENVANWIQEFRDIFPLGHKVS